MPSPEELAREKIDAANFLNSSFSLLPLLGVSRVCISTIQRLYSMLRSFLFWLKYRTWQDQITRGDRPRSLRVQRTTDCAIVCYPRLLPAC